MWKKFNQKIDVLVISGNKFCKKQVNFFVILEKITIIMI